MTRNTVVSIFCVGVLMGCGAAITIPGAFAAPQPGKWECYEANDFDEAGFGANESDAKKFTAGMNRVAARAPAGTVLNISRGQLTGAVCVKN